MENQGLYEILEKRMSSGTDLANLNNTDDLEN